MTVPDKAAPAPLTPPECDLTDFPYLPVDIDRLFNSSFHTQANDTEWRAGVTLWLRSWHQVPAASLPNDDVQLARLAEFGRDVKSWKKVRAKAMRGWVLCSDGQLYHPVVAVKALEAWIEKLVQRRKSGIANGAKYRRPFDAKPVEASIRAAMTMLRLADPESRILERRLAYLRRNGPPDGDESAGGGRQLDIHDGVHDGDHDGLQHHSQGEVEGDTVGIPPPLQVHRPVRAEKAHASVDNPWTEKAKEVVQALAQLGIEGNAADPGLTVLLAAGVQVEAFRQAAPKAKGKAHPWAYLLAAVQGQLLDVSATVLPDAAPAGGPDWWRTPEGIRAFGAAKGKPYSLAALGTGWTDDQQQAHWRRYKAEVFELAGDGPWREAAQA